MYIGFSRCCIDECLYSDLIQERQCSNFAVKVFKTTLNEFQNRIDYVQEDFRFKNTRKVLKLWAEKEYRNLKRLKTSGLPCPDPVTVQSHVLVMSFIGDEKVSAPKLKDVQLDLATWEVLYDELKSVIPIYQGKPFARACASPLIYF
ncbi:putative RIO-type serine/threonine-protein kinase 3 [Trichinella nelsoni]|uniref:non-specific serine/threonine protein kinase n=1 Tax=Trichinella nelsoni TaxID=6336 RepID=A0A0V0SHL9_9BILA|nr:putative RIO-type serine/threonine-protein kinase 3 [Trichinella nelsoni]